MVLADTRAGYYVRVHKIQSPNDLVYEVLEGLHCISQAEWHAREFEQTEWGCDGCFRHVGWLDGDLMVSSDKVDLGKHCFSMQCRSKVVDVWYGILVWYCNSVQRAGVTTETPVSFWAPCVKETTNNCQMGR